MWLVTMEEAGDKSFLVIDRHRHCLVQLLGHSYMKLSIRYNEQPEGNTYTRGQKWEREKEGREKEVAVGVGEHKPLSYKDCSLGTGSVKLYC